MFGQTLDMLEVHVITKNKLEFIFCDLNQMSQSIQNNGSVPLRLYMYINCQLTSIQYWHHVSQSVVCIIYTCYVYLYIGECMQITNKKLLPGTRLLSLFNRYVVAEKCTCTLYTGQICQSYMQGFVSLSRSSSYSLNCYAVVDLWVLEHGEMKDFKHIFIILNIAMGRPTMCFSVPASRFQNPFTNIDWGQLEPFPAGTLYTWSVLNRVFLSENILQLQACGQVLYL